MKTVCFVTTTPLFVNFFLAPHLLNLRKSREVTLVLPLPGEVPLRELPGVEVLQAPIRRKIDPLHDLMALWELRALFRRRRFDLVHSFGPKAGLLAMHAAAMAGVPRRIHTFTGQVWASRRGLMRSLLKAADRRTALAATHVLADSPAQRDYLVAEDIVAAGQCGVLGAGSVAGVDLARFQPDALARAAVRRELGIASSDKVVLYLGRLNRDKGVLDLARAFAPIAESAVLLVVGPDEENLAGEISRLAGRGVRLVGYTEAPERYLAAADLLCLPSYREGIGTATLEGAACGLPVLASRIYGIQDAVVEGQSGLLFQPGNVEALRAGLAKLLGDEALRRRLGEAGRERVAKSFSQASALEALEAFYGEIA
jgi:glycosyltransferase involved in cell wall biosynthesis